MLNLLLTYLDNEQDKRQLADMYANYSKQMVSYACSFLKNQKDAEDAVQNVFLRLTQNAWDTVSQIKNETDLRNYLLKSTKNASLNLIKLRENDNISLNDLSEYGSNAAYISDEDFFKALEEKGKYELVLEIIKKLDSKYRDPLYYHFALGYSIPRVANILCQTLSATQKQLVRGKRKILDSLEAKGAEADVND